jgi:hypothetical protein
MIHQTVDLLSDADFLSWEFSSLAESTHQPHQKSSLDKVLTQLALLRGVIPSYAKCFRSNFKHSIDLQYRNSTVAQTLQALHLAVPMN